MATQGANIVSRYDDKVRRVVFTGDGYFDIAKDADRPFIIENNGLGIKVYGTKFTLRSENSGNTTMVALEEGSIELISATGVSRMLVPTQIATYDRLMQSIKVSDYDVMSESCWTRDTLIFNNRPLREIGCRLARWYDVDIKIDDEIADDYAYTFTLTNESLDNILQLMSKIHTLSYDVSRDVVHISKSK